MERSAATPSEYAFARAPRPEPCGLVFGHTAHWWCDGDHDPDNHWCPGTPAACNRFYAPALGDYLFCYQPKGHDGPCKYESRSSSVKEAVSTHKPGVSAQL